jgi:hypothetical protein
LAVARSARTIRAGFAFDTLIGVMMVTAGAYGARWVISPTFWQSVDPGPSGEPVGAVQVRKGAVRVRSAGKSIWRDVQEREMVRQGDTVATGANGVADLVLLRKDRLRIAPESLVVVDVADPEEKPFELPTGFGNGWFSKVINTVVENQKSDGVRPSAERTFLKVKKGSIAMVEAAPTMGKAALQLEIGGKKVQAQKSQAISVTADGKAKIATVDTAKVEKIEAWAPSPPAREPLQGARIENPVQGAVFREGVPIPFGWAPPSRSAISQIELRQRPQGKVLAQREFPGTGASLRLAQGDYEWRVRLRPVDSETWTEWSESRVISVVKEIKKDEPVAVLQSKGGVPLQGRAALAARQSWKETVAAAAAKARTPAPSAPVVAQKPAGLTTEQLAARSKAAAEARAKAFAEAQARRKAMAEESAKRAQLAAQARAAQQAEVQKKIVAERKARAALQSAIIAASLSRQVAAQGKTAAFDPDKLDRIPVDIAWGSVPGAQSYKITVFRGGKPMRQEDVQIPKYSFDVKNAAETVGLEYEITAQMADGSTISGSRSQIQVSLGSPNLVEPSPASQVTASQNSVFSWSRVALADRYELQVAQEDSFASPVVAKAVSENFEFVTLSAPGPYFWRIRASAGAVKSNWSRPNRFTVK